MMTNTAKHLIGIGWVNAKPAREFAVGECMLWNYGGVEQVLAVTPSASGKTLSVTVRSVDHGDEGTRRLKADRLVGIARAR